MGSPVLRLHARIGSIPLGPPLAGVARQRLLGRFLPWAPARPFDKQPRQHLIGIDLDAAHKVAVTAADGRRERGRRARRHFSIRALTPAGAAAGATAR